MATLLTNAGRTKLLVATPIAPVTIRSMAFGDGGGTIPAVEATRIALVNELIRVEASAPNRDTNDPYVIAVSGTLPRTFGNATLREVGLFDDSGALIAYGDLNNEFIPAPTNEYGYSYTGTIRIRLDNTEQVQVIIADAPDLDHRQLTFRNAPEAHPASAITTLDKPVFDNDNTVEAVLTKLGTASRATVMENLTDTTTPDALMPRGAFGMGGTNPYRNTFSDASDVTQFFTQNTPTNALDGANADGNWWHCIKMVSPDPTLGSRPRGLIGLKTHTTGGFPINPQLWLSQLDSSGNPQRTVRALMQGDFGVGSVIPPQNPVPLNDLALGGTYTVSGGTTDWPFGGSGGTITVDSHGTNVFITQTAHLAAGNSKAVRFKGVTTWSRWFTEYSQANIVGTVSQTAGVPTGAIIQRGANANGQFTRFADGTQDCWAIVAAGVAPNISYGAIFRTNPVSWTYPIAFVDGNVSFHANEYGGVGACWAGLGGSGVTASTASYCGFSAATSLLNMTFSLFAKGRWY
jgi:hypothetical protein